MRNKIVTIGAGLLLIGMLFTPLGTGQTPLVDVSMGIVYEEDFRDGDGGWTANEYPEPTRPDPENPSWEWGAPTSGPGAAYSGSNAWATNLEGLANLDECAAIASPAIDLTGASEASVSFQHWFDMEKSRWSTSGYDAGMLFVTRDGGETFEKVTPEEGYPAAAYWFSTRTCLDGAAYREPAYSGTTADWEAVNVDLDTYAGEEIQFVFAFASRNRNAHDGWYVDDFTVTKDGVSTVEGFESGNGGFTLLSTAPVPAAPEGWSYDVPTSGPGTDDPVWATNPHGDYGPNECSWVESPPIRVGDPEHALGAPLVQATLSWEQWFRAPSGAGQGVVQIGTGDGEYVNIVPHGGYPGTTKYSKDAHIACLNPGEDEVFAGYHNKVGDDLVAYTADVSEWIGEEVTIRFLFATYDSTSTYEGWYVNNVAIELSAYAEGPDVEEHVPEVPDLDDVFSAPGWSSGGEDSTWAYGVAASGPEGETVFMTNLAGKHADKECSWIESPPFPGALLQTDPTLTLDHWYEMYFSSWSGPWGAGVILASTDGGGNWTYVESDAYPYEVTSFSPRGCLKDTHGLDYPLMGFGDATDGFETTEVDLSAFADADTVQLRFLFAGGSIERQGWAIRGVDVGGVSLL